MEHRLQQLSRMTTVPIMETLDPTQTMTLIRMIILQTIRVLKKIITSMVTMPTTTTTETLGDHTSSSKRTSKT